MTTRLPSSTLPRPDAGPVSYDVVATFPTIESARTAADALGLAMIPADCISLIPAQEGLAGTWPAAYNYDERRHVSSTVSSGAILGAILGGVGGLVLAGLVASIANAELSALVLLAVGTFGAVGVGALGGFMSGSTLDAPVGSGPATESWPKIDVQCADERQLSSAIRILRERGALELYRDDELLV
jgi:hypothetical protein